MSWTPIILSFASLGFLLLLTSFMLKDEKLVKLKAILFFYGVFNIFWLGFFPLAISLNPNDASSILPVTTVLFSINIIFLFTFIFMYGIHIFRNLIVGATEEIREARRK